MEEAKLVISAILLVCSAAIISRGAAEPVEDKQSLLDFIVRLPPRRGLNWSPLTSVCDSWRGVACSGDRARVVAVRLPGIGFDGPIPPNTLGRLTVVQILSLRSNGLYGPFPADLANLTALTSLQLQLNSFSGPLPSNLSAWKNLTVLDLSFNAFNGYIPASLSN